MVVEMWAIVSGEGRIEVLRSAGDAGWRGLEIERVRVLEDGEVGVKGTDLMLSLEACRCDESDGYGCDSCSAADRLRACLPKPPAPPTAEEYREIVRRLMNATNTHTPKEEVDSAWDDAADLLARADAARKGGA